MSQMLPNPLSPFSDEQSRVLVNLQAHYEGWLDATRALAALPYHLRWKSVSGRDYLYEDRNRSGSGTSLGPRSPETEAIHQAFVSAKREARARVDTISKRLDQTCKIYRALRLPLIPAPAAAILREADRRGLLGSHFMVVGTNAMPAYAIAAGGFLDAPDETEDFDVAWTAAAIGPDDGEATPIWSMLKAVDSTYTVNTERTFQARNAEAYEVEILVAPSRAGGMRAHDRPRPVPMPAQEWLLRGQQLDHVVVARDGSPARLYVPDPRWYALHKLWMAKQDDRNPLKRSKDAQQGSVVLAAVQKAMPQYALDDAFESSLPDPLLAIYSAWKAQQSKASPGPVGW